MRKTRSAQKKGDEESGYCETVSDAHDPPDSIDLISCGQEQQDKTEQLGTS
jgi:hypothetical protein